MFDQLKEHIRSQTSDFNQVRKDSLDLNTQLRNVTGQSGAPVKPAVRQASQVTERYMDSYVRSGASNVILQSKLLLEEGRGSDAQRKANDKESKAKLKDIKRILSQIENGHSGSTEAFKQLEQYYNANIAFNQASREESKRRKLQAILTIQAVTP